MVIGKGRTRVDRRVGSAPVAFPHRNSTHGDEAVWTKHRQPVTACGIGIVRRAIPEVM
jgi:hypothetical protein